MEVLSNQGMPRCADCGGGMRPAGKPRQATKEDEVPVSAVADDDVYGLVRMQAKASFVEVQPSEEMKTAEFQVLTDQKRNELYNRGKDLSYPFVPVEKQPEPITVVETKGKSSRRGKFIRIESNDWWENTNQTKKENVVSYDGLHTVNFLSGTSTVPVSLRGKSEEDLIALFPAPVIMPGWKRITCVLKVAADKSKIDWIVEDERVRLYPDYQLWYEELQARWDFVKSALQENTLTMNEVRSLFGLEQINESA